MTWIRWDADAPDDPLWVALGDALGIDPMQAMGHHVAMTARLAKHRPDEPLGTLPDLILEQWANWRGKRGRWAAAIRAQCLREDGELRGWWRNRAHIRKQRQDAQRPGEGTRKARAGQTQRPERANAKGPRKAHSGNGTVRYGTEISVGPDPNSPPVGVADATPPAANWVTHAAEIHLAHAGGVLSVGAFARATKPLVDKHGPDHVLAVWTHACQRARAENACKRLRFFAQDFAEWEARRTPAPLTDEDGNWTEAGRQALRDTDHLVRP